MAIKRITRRWMLNSFGVIVVIVLVIVVASSIGISNYYYGLVQQALASRANIVTTSLRQYYEDQTVHDSDAQARRYIASYAQIDDSVELMIIDNSGEITLTSSGFMPDDTASLPDYVKASISADKTGMQVVDLNSQRVMALTLMMPTASSGQQLSAVRILTGLEHVDRQITFIITMIALLGILVLAMVLFSSSYFISSIVNPIGEVGATARKIAQGDLSARLEKKTDDEIGELCDIINYMAGELQTAEKIKNDFISSVSHELRTPLTAIQGWAETLQLDSGEDKNMLQKGMQVIISETGRLSQMVEELLDFSRMQSGRLRLVRGKIDIVAELSEAVLMYQQRANREGIGLDYEETDLIVPVYGDKNKLRQVFVNIIDNAIKYSNEGGNVTVSLVLAGEKVVIEVRDTGIGIREEELPSVKQKFYKANSTRRGSGIGLAVADEIVMRHEGTLEISSRFGYGTTVILTLPVYKGQDEIVEVSDKGPETQEN